MGNEVEPTKSYFQDDEISLREIVLKIREYIQEIFQNWKIILYISIPVLGLMLLRAFITPKEFEAELTFMVNEDEGSKLGGVATILENIGLAPATTNSEYNLDKILELMRSHRIISQSLMQKTKIKDKEDYFANHLIDVYKLHNEWKKEKPELVNFLFTHDSMPIFNRLENTAMKIISKKLLGDSNSPAMLSSSIAENSGIMNMKLTTRSEKMSIDLLEAIYRNLSKFYIDQTTSKQKDTYDKVRYQTDSIRIILAIAERELATFIDKNQNLIPQRAQLRKEQLERDVFVLNTMYGEAVKNAEVAKFALKNKTPFIQAIDLPVEPLKVIKKSKKKAIVMGLLLGMLLSTIFLVSRKIFRDAMAEE